MRIVMLIVLSIYSTSAVAHGVNLFVRTEGGMFIGKATYDDGKPVVGATTGVYNGDDVQIEELTTDRDGMFRYTHDGDMNLLFTVTTPDGHRVSYRGTDDEEEIEHRHEHGDMNGEADLIHEIEYLIQRELGDVREDIHRLENTIRFHDVVGGIGYIVGVLGLIALLKRRQG
ncbi:MAG: hypothetical protein COA73_11750 [Candidatus Hydrogenedentota bacterium]|nr:MAG: hypothetical protein COA73_11750 [Candidatus Hydrogenedentota bacterium]